MFRNWLLKFKIYYIFIFISLLSSISCISTDRGITAERLSKIGYLLPKSSSVIISDIKYRIATLEENIYNIDKNELELIFEITNKLNKRVILGHDYFATEDNKEPFLILFLRNNSGKLVKKYKLNYYSDLKQINKGLSEDSNNNKSLILKANETKEYLLKIKLPKKAIEKYSQFSLKTRLNFLNKLEKRNLLSFFLKKE